MPLPDLSTILLVRLGVEALLAAAFWAQMRRYPAIGGPGWWSLGSALAIAGSVFMILRTEVNSPALAAAAAALMLGANTAAWVGLRSYLQKPLPLWEAGGLLLVHALVQGLWATQFETARGHQLAYTAFSGVLAIWALVDLFRLAPWRSAPEFRALMAVGGFEALVIAALLTAALMDNAPMGGAVASFLLVFLLIKLLRVMIFGALLSLRLRQEAEQARQTMATREAESRALVDNLGAGVMVLLPNQTPVRVNTAARRFLGWPDDRPASQALDWRLLRPDGEPMPRHEVPFERVLATGQPVADVVVGIRSGDDPTVRWALSNAFPENDAKGGLLHVVITFVDITSLKQAQQHQQVLEQQLAQSQKMEALGTLAGGVAHDFNNILAAILGNADLARQDLAPGSLSRESLHEISSAARRGRELVRQILAFSRQQPLARSPVMPGAIVAETCSLLRTAIQPHVQLVQQSGPVRRAIMADPTQLGQVLLNLGTNAVHALQGKPGKIEFLVDEVGPDSVDLPEGVARTCRDSGLGAVRIMVRDNGCGMDEATRARMFEPFFTTKVVGHGTGLGLPVVLGIVEVHGGAITVESSPGKGTTFTLFFPAIDAGHRNDTEIPPGALAEAPAETLEKPAMTDSAASEPRHVLYLDDDDTLVFLVRRLLERKGFKVTAMTDQQEAIAAVQRDPHAFHLLMTDYNMPGMSGIDVARAVLAINPSLPVAVASGYISDELQSEAGAVGVTEIVFKTDAVEAFCDVVQRLALSPGRA
jgi:two-component system, cell cycle sensor histidine kinase and response regulator CckA